MQFFNKITTICNEVLQLKNGPLWLLLMAVGGWVMIGWASNFIEEIYNRLLRPARNLKKMGKWAVVTGATDGIGLAMAMELARKGMSVMLISRTQSKLDDCKKKIEGVYANKGIKGCECTTMVVDFSAFGVDKQLMNRVKTTMEDLDIGVLVNNVGISYDFCKYFHELDEDRVEQLINMNVNSTTYMCRYVLPGMQAKKKGCIVNMASAAGVVTAPLLAQYGAAKSYIAVLSKTLHEENKKFNVHVQCQVPLFVVSRLASIKKPSFTVPMPDGYAKYAVAAIGYENIVSPYWTHSPYLWLLQTLPESLSVWIMDMVHQDIRRRGLKKQASKKE